MIDLLLIATLAQAPPPPEPTPGGDRRDGISAEVFEQSPALTFTPTEPTI
jgi:hypothetical protein